MNINEDICRDRTVASYTRVALCSTFINYKTEKCKINLTRLGK